MDKKIFDKVFGWKSKGFSKENIVNPATSNNGFSPKITFSYYSIIAVMLKEIVYIKTKYLWLKIVTLAAPNKRSFNAKSVFKLCDQESNS